MTYENFETAREIYDMLNYIVEVRNLINNSYDLNYRLACIHSSGARFDDEHSKIIQTIRPTEEVYKGFIDHLNNLYDKYDKAFKEI